MGIGFRIKEAREKAGLTQEELGKIIGVTGSAITNYEKETSHPKESVMYALIDALGVSPNYLFQDCVATLKQPAEDGELSKEANRMIKLLREIPDNQKELAVDLVESVLLAVIRNAPVPAETQAVAPVVSNR